MKTTAYTSLALLPILSLAGACGKTPPATSPGGPSAASVRQAGAAPVRPPAQYGDLTREQFNRLAVRKNLPLFWSSDKNQNGAVDADEVASLLFYPSPADGVQNPWVSQGKLTPAFDAAYASIVKTANEQPTGNAGEVTRRSLVAQDLDQGMPTLVYNDLRASSPAEKEFVGHVLAATKLVDAIFAIQTGSAALASQVPSDDTASQSLFRRNWGPKCTAPKTDKNPACSAIPGAPQALVDSYPASLQADANFCEAIEKRPDEKALLDPFTVVRAGAGAALSAVPITAAYADKMTAIAKELRAAAASLDTSEAALSAYLTAAAQSFSTNDWGPADEAWSKMNATNSKWYLRIGADEVYWEPCSHKAGFHVTFARINKDSLAWQTKLTPVQQAMEQDLASLIGSPYKARSVTFHLPDFIDIVWNAGDDRTALGATIGQSLPNWGKVANEGRGRTVAMSNLYTDSDSLRVRRSQAESLLTSETMAGYSEGATPGLLSTILHEATHNLGPSHEYEYKGKTDEQAFGGGLASMMEELKAQTGALYFVDFVARKNLISAELARQTYTDSIVWAFGHISRGMYTPEHKRKAYSQLAAVQIGFLMDEGALTFDSQAMAANGTDKGAFTIQQERMPAAVAKMMKAIGMLKATGDKDGATALASKYVDGDVVPHKLIAERYLRSPKVSFVYALDM